MRAIVFRGQRDRVTLWIHVLRPIEKKLRNSLPWLASFHCYVDDGDDGDDDETFRKVLQHKASSQTKGNTN